MERMANILYDSEFSGAEKNTNMTGKREITVIGNTRDKIWTAEVKITTYKIRDGERKYNTE
jgi:hypothetical protein